MGLFDKVKSKNSSNNKEDKKTKKINKSLEKYNVFEGVKVKATFPEKEVVIKSHGGLTKGVATLTFGLAGLGATSGVKQEKKNKSMDTIFQVVEKGVVFKKATDDGKDLRIPYDNIVKVYKDTGLVQMNNRLFIQLLENQKITLLVSASMRHNENIRNYLLEILNERATGIENEEDGWGLESANTESLSESQTPKLEETNSTNELEKIMDMYQKGLLTDEEFAAMKKKIIEQ